MNWQPIETAPKDGIYVIVMYKHISTQCVFNAFYIDDSPQWGLGEDDKDEIGWWSYVYSEGSRVKLDDWQNPTHWMPLPGPPEA